MTELDIRAQVEEQLELNENQRNAKLWRTSWEKSHEHLAYGRMAIAVVAEKSESVCVLSLPTTTFHCVLLEDNEDAADAEWRHNLLNWAFGRQDAPWPSDWRAYRIEVTEVGSVYLHDITPVPNDEMLHGLVTQESLRTNIPVTKDERPGWYLVDLGEGSDWTVRGQALWPALTMLATCAGISGLERLLRRGHA